MRACARVVALFEALTPADVARLGEFYAADARFKDPFNEVQGVPAIERIFDHMFVALDEPRFVVRDIVVEGDQCFLTWDFLFRFRRFSRDDADRARRLAPALRRATAASRCTATTGTRPRSCTRSCRWSAR